MCSTSGVPFWEFAAASSEFADATRLAREEVPALGLSDLDPANARKEYLEWILTEVSRLRSGRLSQKKKTTQQLRETDP